MGSGWLLDLVKRLCQQTMSQSLIMIHHIQQHDHDKKNHMN